MALLVKICGLSTPETVATAVAAGADMVGFMFYPRSPRNVSVETSAALADLARGRATIVAVMVDPTDEALETITAGLKPDLLQLHGSESAERVSEIRQRFGIPVMKVLAIATAQDLAPIPEYAGLVDSFLFDAKPSPSTAHSLPGGNGISFDWRLVKGLEPGKPALLSGGLNASNVADAIRLTGMGGVDVSSGVESRPGEKDPAMIEAFIAAARSAL